MVSAIGYRDVFWTIFSTRALVLLTVFLATAIIIWCNGWLASRLAKPGIGRSLELAGATVHPPLSTSVPDILRTRLHLFIAGSAVFLGGLLAAAEMTNWDTLLRFIYQVPYGRRDPVFGNDLGFYLFSLPAYIALKNWMLLTVSLSLLEAGVVYWVRGHIELEGHRRECHRRRSPMAPLCSASSSLSKRGLMGWTAIFCCTVTMVLWWGQATRTCTLGCRSFGC